MKLTIHLPVESRLRRRGALPPQSCVPYWLCIIYAFVTFVWSATVEWGIILVRILKRLGMLYQGIIVGFQAFAAK